MLYPEGQHGEALSVFLKKTLAHWRPEGRNELS